MTTGDPDPGPTQRRHAAGRRGAARRHLRALAVDRRARAGRSGRSRAWPSSSSRWCRWCARPDASAQLALIRAHPELAGKAMVAKTLTAESTHEQGKAGLTDCTPEEFARIQQLNADYNAQASASRSSSRCAGRAARACTRPRSSRPSSGAWTNHPDFELAECLRNIHRIAEMRLDDKFGHVPELGNLVWDWAERLATHSDPGYAERGELTVTYLTDAHRACAQRLSHWMRADCGFDEVEIDAVGNVVGVYHGRDRERPAPAHRQPLRHRAQWRQVRRARWASSCRWPACANCTRRAGACPSASRWSASPKRRASATRRCSSARAR